MSEVREEAFDVATVDGTMPVRSFTPGRRPKGGVIVYMDAFGIRPELFGMARRYADAGYATFLPDLYYRLGSPLFRIPASAADPLDPGMTPANVATTVEMTLADTGALLAHVMAETPGLTRFGTVGYCMGARHALGACATYPEEIAATACLHGGRMVWDGPNSPHLFIPKLSGSAYFAFAADDETCPDAHQRLIEETIRASGARASVEHFAATHGWTFPERWCFDKAAAERAHARVLALFDAEVAARSAS